MKIKAFMATLLLLLLSIMSVACGKEQTSALEQTLSPQVRRVCGSWAYIHDKETPVAVFEENGNAVYEDEKYSFDCDAEYILLKSPDGEEQRLRYRLEDEGYMLLYKNTVYAYAGEGEPADLTGWWRCEQNNWSFEFTDAGTFLEDGFFPGQYTVDNETQTFTLSYSEQFEDTVCFYRIEGKELYIEYPWTMVKMD